MPRDVLNIPTPGWRAADDVALFGDSVAAFVADHCVPNIERWEETGSVDRDLWTKAGAAGLLVPSCPEEHGGAGGDYRHDAAFIEAQCRQGVESWGAPLHNSIVAPYVWHYGTPDQKARWLPKLLSGEYVGAIAMTEPGAGSDLQGVKTTAIKDGDRYRVNGAKTFITNGQQANFIILVSKTDPSEGAKGVSLVAIETDDVEGFRRGRNLDKVGLKGQDTSELFFDDVLVRDDNILGSTQGRGFFQLMEQLPQERLQIGLQAICAIELALELTLDYVKERKAFGKQILDFQNTQFVLAECKTEASVARVFIDHCIERLVRGDLDSATGSMAKYWVSDLQMKIVDRCVQLFGGYGYMNEYPIARMWRDARVQSIYGGTNEIMKLLIARTL